MNVQALSDQVLLNHYLSGDQSAISKLIERHSRRVRDYINMMVKDRDVAEDIFQETFIKAVRVIDDGRYTDNGKFLSWILRIAHNQVIDHFRAQRQNKTVTEAEAGYDVLGSLRFAERNVEDAMVARGYREAGYTFVNVDDCWMSLERDKNGRLQPNPEKFPSGMKALGDYLHERGLRAHSQSCPRRRHR